MLIPVILSGGAGSRLWPVSREQHPKPFMTLPDGLNMLQSTLSRLSGLKDVADVITVTNKELEFLTKDAYQQMQGKVSLPDSFSYIYEPVGRNTAPAIAIAARFIREKYGEEALVLVLSADHLIRDKAAFDQAVKSAVELARQNRLVTFGIQPTYPESGYGYIEADGSKVIRFVEKPSVTSAQEYINTGRYYWNAGMFCFKAGQMLKELEEYQPQLCRNLESCFDSAVKLERVDGTEIALAYEQFSAMPDLSIDYALMEHSKNVAVVPCDFGWSDIGSWTAMGDLHVQDALGNQLEGEGTILNNAQDCFVKNDSGRTVALIGVKNLVVVDTPDALLIADKQAVQDVKKVVSTLKQQDHYTHKHHCTVQRPWGSYTVLEESEGYKMKRIEVRPGQSLSLQLHHHRSEHWIIVSGSALIVNGENEILLQPNQSTYIPAGQKHRLTNPGMIPCVMIEVQVGQYLGEDDIVRFTDVYGRV